MLIGRHQGGIKGIEVNVLIGQLTGHYRPQIKMDVVQRLDQPADVVQVAQARFAGAARFQIEDEDGRAAGAQVDALAAQIEIGLAILAVQHYLAIGLL